MKPKTARVRTAFHASGFDRLETREVLSHASLAHAKFVHFFHLKPPAPPPAVVAPPPVSAGPILAPQTSGNRNSPMAKLGNDLINLYQSFVTDPSGSSTIAAKFPSMMFKGDKVALDVQTKANVNTFATELTNLGMDITNKSATYGTVSGYFPINQLRTLASLPDTLSGQPAYKPVANGFGH